MIAMEHKATNNTAVFALAQRLPDSVATVRTVLRSECGRNFPYPTASAFSLARKDRKERVPSSITDRFCEAVVFQKSRNVQIFNCDLIVLGNQPITQLVEEITSLIGNELMLSREDANSFLSVSASTLLFTHLPLGDFEYPLRLAEVLRIVDVGALRSCSETFYPEIDSDCVTRARNEPRLIFVNNEDDEPTIRLALDRAIADLAVDWTTEADSNRAQLRKYELIAVEFESVTPITKGIETFPALKPREAAFLALQASLKEGVVGLCRSAQGLIKNICIYRSGIWPHLADFFYFRRLMEVVYRFPSQFVRIPAFLNGCVVKLAANLKRLLKLCGGALIRFELEFVGFHRTLIVARNQFSHK